MQTKTMPKWLYYYQITGLALIPIVLMFVIWAMVWKVQFTNNIAEIWWGSLNYFSQQSNFIVMIFIIIFFFWPKSRILKDNTFFLIAVAYISITGFIFNIILMPVGFAVGIAQTMVLAYWATIVSTLMLHMVMPIYFILFYVFCYKTKAIDKVWEKKYWKYILKGSIYPICFLFYVFIVPFITDRWVYTHFSNCNPNLIGYEPTGQAVFGDNVTSGPYTGNPLYVFIFFGVYLVVVLSLSMYWLLMQKKPKPTKK